MDKPVNEREIALAVLLEVTENGKYSHIMLRDVLSKYQYLEKRERAFITRVVEGTLEHMIEIDYILKKQLLKKQQRRQTKRTKVKARAKASEIFGTNGVAIFLMVVIFNKHSRLWKTNY